MKDLELLLMRSRPLLLLPVGVFFLFAFDVVHVTNRRIFCPWTVCGDVALEPFDVIDRGHTGFLGHFGQCGEEPGESREASRDKGSDSKHESVTREVLSIMRQLRRKNALVELLFAHGPFLAPGDQGLIL